MANVRLLHWFLQARKIDASRPLFDIAHKPPQLHRILRISPLDCVSSEKGGCFPNTIELIRPSGGTIFKYPWPSQWNSLIDAETLSVYSKLRPIAHSDEIPPKVTASRREPNVATFSLSERVIGSINGLSSFDGTLHKQMTLYFVPSCDSLLTYNPTVSHISSLSINEILPLVDDNAIIRLTEGLTLDHISISSHYVCGRFLEAKAFRNVRRLNIRSCRFDLRHLNRINPEQIQAVSVNCSRGENNSWLAAAKMVEIADVSYSTVCQHLPDCHINRTNLNVLTADGSSEADVFAGSVMNSQITKLSLRFSDLTDSGLAILTKCGTLKDVFLLGTQVSEDGVNAARHARPDCNWFYE